MDLGAGGVVEWPDIQMNLVALVPSECNAAAVAVTD